MDLPLLIRRDGVEPIPGAASPGGDPIIGEGAYASVGRGSKTHRIIRDKAAEAARRGTTLVAIISTFAIAFSPA